jgi:hypothetical protein
MWKRKRKNTTYLIETSPRTRALALQAAATLWKTGPPAEGEEMTKFIEFVRSLEKYIVKGQSPNIKTDIDF